MCVCIAKQIRSTLPAVPICVVRAFAALARGLYDRSPLLFNDICMQRWYMRRIH
jgi:hypothetical protein